MQKIILSMAVLSFFNMQFIEIFCSNSQPLAVAIIINQPNNQQSIKDLVWDEVRRIEQALDDAERTQCYSYRFAEKDDAIRKLVYLKDRLSNDTPFHGLSIQYPSSPFTVCGCCLCFYGPGDRMNKALRELPKNISESIIADINIKLNEKYG